MITKDLLVRQEPRAMAPSSVSALGECLHRYEQEHQTFFDSSPDLTVRFDRELRFVYVNPAFAVATGKPEQAFLGLRPSELGSEYGQLHRWEAPLARAAHRGREEIFEITWSVRGSDRVFEVRAIPERGKGGVVATILAVMRDVTARRAAEAEAQRTREYFRALIADSSDLLAVLDGEGVIRFCSDSSRPLLGYSPEQLIGQTVFALVHEQEQPRVRETFTASVRRPGVGHRAEARVRHADGSWRRFEVLGKSTVQPTGGPVVILNARDVTEHQRMESLMQRSQRMAAIGRMADGVAHQFNNLLTTILGTCEILAQDLPDHPGVHTSLEVIRNAGTSAVALTQHLFALGHRRPLSPDRVDLGQLFDELRPLLTRLLGAGTSLHLEAGPGDVVEMDRGLLEQLIVNLACNARERMSDGGRLTVTSRTLLGGHRTRSGHTGRPAERTVRLAFSNGGVTMDPASLEQLTDPFRSTATNAGVDAVALAAVHAILAQGGGLLTAVPGPKQSNDLWVDLPAGLPAVVEPAASTPAPPVGRAAGWDTIAGHETILVVEDDHDVLDVTARFLMRLGYDVLPAADPTAALAIAESHPTEIHLVLSDVNLPGMSGPALVRRLQTLRPSLKAMYASGYVGTSDDGRSILPPGAVFLQKPYSVVMMGEALRTLLGHSPGPLQAAT